MSFFFPPLPLLSLFVKEGRKKMGVGDGGWGRLEIENVRDPRRRYLMASAAADDNRL